MSPNSFILCEVFASFPSIVDDVSEQLTPFFTCIYHKWVLI